jgi:hypothetical protein
VHLDSDDSLVVTSYPSLMHPSHGPEYGSACAVPVVPNSILPRADPHELQQGCVYCCHASLFEDKRDLTTYM